MKITAEFRSSISTIIPVIANLLKHSDGKVHQAGVYTLSQLSKQGKTALKLLDVALLMALAEFRHLIGITIPEVVKSLKDSDWQVCEAGLHTLSQLLEQGKMVNLSCPPLLM